MAKEKLYDIAIIGAGPAGMTAAIYAGRANKTVAIIDKEGFGGQITKSPKIENYPGFANISGVDLATNIYSQMSTLETVSHILGEVILITYLKGVFICHFSDNKTICSKSLIIATGSKPKTLNLDTKNLYYCATCDGPFFKGKEVIVVGSGNTGATYALELASYCNHVYMCDTTFNLMCEPVLAAQVEAKSDKITFLPNCTIKSVENTRNKLTAITLSTNETIKVSAIFGAIGTTPQTAFISDQLVDKDEYGYIISVFGTIDKVPGLFAAGDCRTSQVKQITAATADGTFTAMQAIKFLNKHNL